MTGGQIAALIFAILLLLPGGCLVLFGFGIRPSATVSLQLVPIGLVILAIAGLLFGVAFRPRRGGPADSATQCMNDPQRPQFPEP